VIRSGAARHRNEERDVPPEDLVLEDRLSVLVAFVEQAAGCTRRHGVSSVIARA